MITSHPSNALVLDYASGSLAEGMALAIASHASLCRACSERIGKLERLGGELLQEVETADADGGSLAAMLLRLEEPEPFVAPPPPLDAETNSLLPKPLRQYVGGSLKDLAWKRVGRMYEEVRLPLSRKNLKVSLMRLKPGSLMPQHTHRGQEITLVLAGGYTDNGRAFIRGDFDAKGPSHKHQPVVDEDGECLCFVVLDAPVRLTGTLGRLVNPFLRI